jgi:hypothetical protein
MRARRTKRIGVEKEGWNQLGEELGEERRQKEQ